MRLFVFWEQFLQDLRYAVRMMAAQPLFTAMAALSLALGIGANTAIYSFMDAILLRALPVRNPESLVVVNWHSKDHPPIAHSLNGTTFKDAKTGYTSGNFPFPGYELFRSSPAFETGSTAHRWLTEAMFVGVGERRPDHVRLKVYEVL